MKTSNQVGQITACLKTMKEYHKIQTCFFRDEKTKRILEGQWTLPEFQNLKRYLMTYNQIKSIKQKCKDIITLCNVALPNSDNEYISRAIQDRLNSLTITNESQTRTG